MKIILYICKVFVSTIILNHTYIYKELCLHYFMEKPKKRKRVTSKVKKRLFKTGNSVCLVIPYKTLKKLKLKVGDLVEAKIKKAK